MDEPGRRELFMKAVKFANIPEIEAQLGADPDVLFPINVNYYEDNKFMTPLIAAIQLTPDEQTALQIVDILLNAGADLNMRQHDPMIVGVDTYPLSLALKRGYYDVARALSDNNKLDLKPRYLQCSYFYTAASPPLDLIRLFAETYARANDRISPSVLRFFPQDVAVAAAYGQNDILKILVAALQRFMPSVAQKCVNSALHSVGSAAAINTLINAGADVNKERHGTFPLMANYEISDIYLQTAESKTEVARALMQAGADVSLCDRRGQTPLMIAILSDDSDTPDYLLGLRINDLLHFGAEQSINRRDKKGRTALMYAAFFGSSSEIINTLIRAGSRLNYVGKKGETALHLAAISLNSNAIEALLAAGADHDILDNRNRNAFRIAEKAFLEWSEEDGDEASAISVEKKRGAILLLEAFIKKKELFTSISNKAFENFYYDSAVSDRAALRSQRAEHYRNLVHPKLLSSIRYSVPIGENYNFLGQSLSPSDPRGPAGFTALGYAAHLGHTAAVEALAQAGVSFLEPGNSAGASVSAIASRAGHKVLADKLAIMAAKEVARIDPLYRQMRSELIVKNKVDFGADIVNSIFSFIAIPDVFPPVAPPPPPQRPPPPPLAVEEGGAAERFSKRQRR